MRFLKYTAAALLALVASAGGALAASSSVYGFGTSTQDTIAGMEALPGTTYRTVIVKGTQGGTFKYETTCDGTVDGGIYFTTSAGGTTCWARQFTGALDIAYYGAVGDWNDVSGTGTDNTSAMQSTADAANNLGGGEIQCSDGDYGFTQIKLYSNEFFHGLKGCNLYGLSQANTHDWGNAYIKNNGAANQSSYLTGSYTPVYSDTNIKIQIDGSLQPASVVTAARTVMTATLTSGSASMNVTAFTSGAANIAVGQQVIAPPIPFLTTISSCPGGGCGTVGSYILSAAATASTSATVNSYAFSGPSIYLGGVEKADVSGNWCTGVFQWSTAFVVNKLNVHDFTICEPNATRHGTEDGIHIVAGDGVTISNGDIQSGDDMLALGVGYYNQSISNVAISNITGSTPWATCFKVAENGVTSASGYAKNVAVSGLHGNCGTYRNGGIYLMGTSGFDAVNNISIASQLTLGTDTTNTTNCDGVFARYAKSLWFSGSMSAPVCNGARFMDTDNVHYGMLTPAPQSSGIFYPVWDYTNNGTVYIEGAKLTADASYGGIRADSGDLTISNMVMDGIGSGKGGVLAQGTLASLSLNGYEPQGSGYGLQINVTTPVIEISGSNFSNITHPVQFTALASQFQMSASVGATTSTAISSNNISFFGETRITVTGTGPLNTIGGTSTNIPNGASVIVCNGTGAALTLTNAATLNALDNAAIGAADITLSGATNCASYVYQSSRWVGVSKW